MNVLILFQKCLEWLTMVRNCPGHNFGPILDGLEHVMEIVHLLRPHRLNFCCLEIGA